MSGTKRIHIQVRGRVQGVGFRYFTHRQARSLGLVGYVRNLPGGGVEIEAEGSSPEVDALLSAVKQGPPGATLRDVTTHSQPTRGTESAFDIRF